MTTLTEKNLQISFPRNVNVRRFDDNTTHGLSHCMKAVDFIVEETDRLLFIEFKDPDNPLTPDAERNRFVEKLLSGRLDDDLKYKYRDSFLYEWASGRLDKPIYFFVLLALDSLSAPELITRTESLRRKLPVNGPPGIWNRQIVADCMVFNLETWNQHLQRFPIARIAP